MLKGGDKVILVICDEGRYIPVQIVNVPDGFSFFDLPRCLQRIKDRVRTPIIAVEIRYVDNQPYSIKYLAEKDV